MKFSVSAVAVIMAALFCFSGAVYAANWQKYDKPVPTKVVVRVLSHGAKSMSQATGAKVSIKDGRTNEVLVEGDVQGSTGDTTALMRAGYPRISGEHGLLKGERGMIFEDLKADEKAREKGWRSPDPYYDTRDERDLDDLEPVIYESTQDAAKFEATLMLDKPTQVFVEVQGPLMPHHAAQLSVVSTWLFPGEDVTGEGIVVTLRGLIVEAQASLKESEQSVEAVGKELVIPFNMRMMCGCPIQAGGRMGIPWEAEGFEITTRAYYKGEMYHESVTTADKIISGTSWFTTNIPMPENLPDGEFSRERVLVRILAAQPKLANYGMEEFSVYLKN